MSWKIPRYGFHVSRVPFLLIYKCERLNSTLPEYLMVGFVVGTYSPFILSARCSVGGILEFAL